MSRILPSAFVLAGFTLFVAGCGPEDDMEARRKEYAEFNKRMREKRAEFVKTMGPKRDVHPGGRAGSKPPTGMVRIEAVPSTMASTAEDGTGLERILELEVGLTLYLDGKRIGEIVQVVPDGAVVRVKEDGREEAMQTIPATELLNGPYRTPIRK